MTSPADEPPAILERLFRLCGPWAKVSDGGFVVSEDAKRWIAKRFKTTFKGRKTRRRFSRTERAAARQRWPMRKGLTG